CVWLAVTCRTGQSRSRPVRRKSRENDLGTADHARVPHRSGLAAEGIVGTVRRRKADPPRWGRGALAAPAPSQGAARLPGLGSMAPVVTQQISRNGFADRLNRLDPQPDRGDAA